MPFITRNAVDLLFYTSFRDAPPASSSPDRAAACCRRGGQRRCWRYALALAAPPSGNEGTYSYYAVPQRALLWAMTAWLCLFVWQGDTGTAGCAGRGVVLLCLRHL